MSLSTDHLPLSIRLLPLAIVVGLLVGGLLVARYGRAEFRQVGLAVVAIGLVAGAALALERR